MDFFKRFPKIEYDGTIFDDLTYRVTLADYIKSNLTLLEKYIVRAGQKPEDVAHDLYGDATLWWLVLMVNDITDPYYEWLMTDKEVQEYTLKKWGSLTGVHHYVDSNGYVVPEGTSGAIPVTYLEYEQAQNEQRREIHLLKPDYLNQTINELNRLLNEAS